MNTCNTCACDKVCDHDKYGFENCNNYIGNAEVVRLPCNFLQTVYVMDTIANGFKEPTEMKCIGFSLSHDSYVANLKTNKNKLYHASFGEFGKSVFNTPEELEQALKERAGR